MTDDAARRALIVGAGPGGLTAAIALRRVGIDAVVLERQHQVRSSGGGIGVQSNALRALMKLGIGERIVNAGSELRAQEINDLHGKRLFSFPTGEVADAYGTPAISLLRSELQLTLIDALEEGVLQTGSECVEVRQDEDGVTAVLSDGRTERGALLIGADGGRSAVRKHVFGAANTEPRYSGFSSWRAVIEMDEGFLPAGTARSYLGAGTQFVMFPAGGRRIYWGLMKGTPQGGSDGGEGAREMLLEDLKAFPESTRELVLATPEAGIMRADVCDRDPDPTWVKGRVVLLGDAAHMTTPFVGQGAGISMEDSIVLAKELALTNGLRDQRMIANALALYEQARMPRCYRIVLLSRRRGRMFAMSNPALVAVRNAVFRAVPDRVWRKQMEQSNAYEV